MLLKEIVTLISRVASLVLETLKQSRQRTKLENEAEMIFLTSANVITSEGLFNQTLFGTSKFLLLRHFRLFVTFRNHHIKEIDEQIMSILLLKAAKPRIPDADSREQLRWIVSITHSSDVDKEIS